MIGGGLGDELGVPSLGLDEGVPSEGLPEADAEGDELGDPEGVALGLPEADAEGDELGEAEGVPSLGLEEAVPSLGVPSDGEVEGVPSLGLALSLWSEGESDGVPSDGVPSDGELEGVPSDGVPSEGVPSLGELDGVPSEGVPSEGLVEGVPSDGVLEGVPSDGLVDGVPSDGVLDGVPSDGELDGVPSEGELEGVPSDGVPSDGDKDGVPSDGVPSLGVPSDGEDDGVPSDGEADSLVIFLAQTIPSWLTHSTPSRSTHRTAIYGVLPPTIIQPDVVGFVGGTVELFVTDSELMSSRSFPAASSTPFSGWVYEIVMVSLERIALLVVYTREVLSAPEEYDTVAAPPDGMIVHPEFPPAPNSTASSNPRVRVCPSVPRTCDVSSGGVVSVTSSGPIYPELLIAISSISTYISELLFTHS